MDRYGAPQSPRGAAGATLVDPEEFVRVAAVLDRYAAARSGAGLDHDAAITRAVTTPRPV